MIGPYYDDEPEEDRWQETVRGAAGLLARYILLLLSCAACALATGVLIMAVKWVLSLL